MREYEAVYIFDSTLEESVVNEKLDRYQGMVAGDGAGQVTAVDHWWRRQLAYPIDDQQMMRFTGELWQTFGPILSGKIESGS